MRSKWRTATIGDLVTLQRGFDLPSQERKAGSIPVMGSAGISGYHDKASTSGPGVVIGRSGVGSMGVTSFIDRDFWALNRTTLGSSTTF
jgi:type I restriction enzyme S subunit